jgi:hypothetical protein
MKTKKKLIRPKKLIRKSRKGGMWGNANDEQEDDESQPNENNLPGEPWNPAWPPQYAAAEENRNENNGSRYNADEEDNDDYFENNDEEDIDFEDYIAERLDGREDGNGNNENWNNGNGNNENGNNENWNNGNGNGSEEHDQSPMAGCCTTSLEDKMEQLEGEIENVSEKYEMLVNGIAEQTLGQYLHDESLELEPTPNLERWHRGAVRRASIYQQITLEDLNKAFLYLLPTFQYHRKFMILSKDKHVRETSMHTMVKKYAYKMFAALFTQANITKAVLRYNVSDWNHQPLENLLYVMQGGSRAINGYLTDYWNVFMDIPMGNSWYHHSGGNLIYMIAAMLCYLYDTWHSEDYEMWQYGDSILEVIRAEFEQALWNHEGTLDNFYHMLTENMYDETYREHLRNATTNLSDFDLIFFGPDDLVDHIDNPDLFNLNELSAYVLRKVLIDGHSDHGTEKEYYAKNLLPFSNELDDPRWPGFRFFNRSGITPETIEMMNELNEDGLLFNGHRQTSNKIIDEDTRLNMYLNRVKGACSFFYDLNLENIPEELQQGYANVFGELIDMSVGVRHIYDARRRRTTTPFYYYKHEQFKRNNYHSLGVLEHELADMIQLPANDKTPKRIGRHSFIRRSDGMTSGGGMKYVNDLYRIMCDRITFA